MKVKFTKSAKEHITVSQLPDVKKVIEVMKDDISISEYVKMAVKMIVPRAWSIEVLKADAQIAGNIRANNEIHDTSGNLDVWIEATVFVNDSQFIIIGSYVSDIWHEMPGYMFSRIFKETECQMGDKNMMWS